MIRGRIFLNEFAADLNQIFDGDASSFGVHYDKFRLMQFVTTVNSKIEEDNKKILESVSHEDEEVAASILSQFHYDNSLHHFKDLLLKSIFVISYSLVEKRLFDTCIICGKHYPITDFKKFRKKHGQLSDLIIPQEYLKDQMKIDFHLIINEWDMLLNYQEVRKVIVHKGSEIEETQKLSFFSKDPFLSLEDNFLKIIDEKFVENFLDLSSDFQLKLVHTINTQLNLVKRP